MRRIVWPATALVLLAMVGFGAWTFWLRPGPGSGGDDRLRSDFLRDRQALVQALRTNDAARAAEGATGNALFTLEDQVSQQQSLRYTLDEDRSQTSVTVVSAPDPQDPTITRGIAEQGTVTRTRHHANGAVEVSTLKVDDRYWLRELDGLYLDDQLSDLAVNLSRPR